CPFLTSPCPLCPPWFISLLVWFSPPPVICSSRHVAEAAPGFVFGAESGERAPDALEVRVGGAFLLGDVEPRLLERVEHALRPALEHDALGAQFAQGGSLHGLALGEPVAHRVAAGELDLPARGLGQRVPRLAVDEQFERHGRLLPAREVVVADDRMKAEAEI